MRERAGGALALGGEERQLAAPCVGADQRESLGPIDDVHPHVTREQVGQAVAVGDPQRYMVEGLDLHGRSLEGTPPCGAPIMSSR